MARRPAIEELERQREGLREKLAATAEMRPGSLVGRYRRCGKPTCHCASEGAAGHGPSWSLTPANRSRSTGRFAISAASSSRSTSNSATRAWERNGPERRPKKGAPRSLRGGARRRSRGTDWSGHGRGARLRGHRDSCPTRGPEDRGPRHRASPQRGPLGPYRAQPALPLRRQGLLCGALGEDICDGGRRRHSAARVLPLRWLR